MRHVDYREGERFQKVILQFLLYKLYTARIRSFVTFTHIPDQSFPSRRKQLAENQHYNILRSDANQIWVISVKFVPSVD